MAILFVDDGGSNTSPFDTWAKACTTGIQGAMADAACVAGSTIYVGHDSTATYSANVTYTNNGTLAAPINVYSVTQGDESIYNDGAIEDASGGVYDILTGGYANIYGVHFKAGDDFKWGSGENNKTWQFEDCHLELTGTNASDTLFNQVGVLGAVWKLFNTNLTFGNAGQGIHCLGGNVFEWFGGALNTDINELVKVHNNRSGNFRVRGVDLGAMVGGAFFNGFGGSGDEADFSGEIIGCKLNATPPVLVTDTLPGVDGVYLAMIGCGSAGIPQTHIHTSQGDITQETTVVRTAKYDGTNKYSMKMITNANADFHTPLRFKLAEIWCAANPTLTIECTHDAQGTEAGGNFGDDEFWIEIEYPDSTVPAYRKWDRTSRMATLGSSVIRSAGTSGDWTNGKTDFDKVEETISGGGAGIHTVWACLAPASKTVYVCPKIDVS